MQNRKSTQNRKSMQNRKSIQNCGNMRSRSVQLFKNAQKVIPGGVNSPVRAFKSVGSSPIFIQRAKGPFLYDEDGNRYIDYCLSWGPMILGHADKDVLSEVRKVMARGTSYGIPTILETQLAEMVVSAFDSIDKVRFVSSGTEAVMTAIRLARGATGRDMVIKFKKGLGRLRLRQ